MKKILVLCLILFFSNPAAFAWPWDKKSAVSIPEGSGYVGKLPNIEESFAKPAKKETSPSFDYRDGFNDPDYIKPAPRNNPAFINIIKKKDKTSQYVNDINDMIFIIEKLQTEIEDKENIQKFNAQSYFLKTNVEYFRDKYKNKAERSYLSYRRLMELNTHVQSVAMLRLEREVYSPYVSESQSGNSFSENNINRELEYLLDDIRQTLVVLKETK